MTDYVFAAIGVVLAISTFLLLSFGYEVITEYFLNGELTLAFVGFCMVVCGLFGVVLTAASFMAAGEY